VLGLLVLCACSAPLPPLDEDPIQEKVDVGAVLDQGVDPDRPGVPNKAQADGGPAAELGRDGPYDDAIASNDIGVPSDHALDQVPIAADSKVLESGPPCILPTVKAACANGWCTIPAGCYLMGSPPAEACREQGAAPGKETQHQVILSRGFVVSQTETTRDQFKGLMGYDPANTNCPIDCPVTNVNWHESAAYCNALSEKDGLAACYSCSGPGTSVKCDPSAIFKAPYECPGYRLPTEAEWEYAYRAGTATAYYNGTSDGSTCEGIDPIADAIGWYDKNVGGSDPRPVAGRQANGWGLYDMAGNVFEWCDEGFVTDLSVKDTVDPWVAPGVSAVTRGGSFATQARKMRAAYRGTSLPELRSTVQGFRCVKGL
jgi:formylglycine-generating enzyme required for sulfatase activity